MIKTCYTRLKLTKSQTDLLDSMCNLCTKAKHTGFKLIAKNNAVLFKNKINNKNKLKIYTKSKVYLLDYIVNSNLPEDKPADEWSVISNLYKTLQKDTYKEKKYAP